MTVFTTTEINKFFATLLKNNAFDGFYLKSGRVRTYYDISFDGKNFPEYFDLSEQEERKKAQYVRWEDVKDTVLSLIKGKRTPLVMEFVLTANESLTEKTAARANVNLNNETVSLSMNITFKDGNLKVVTGTFRSGFSLEKSLDEEWDKEVSALLKQNSIMYEVL